MERVDRIVSHVKYQAYLKEIEELEQERIFCRHQMGHFLSVARIAMLMKEEEGLFVDKELIYAAALLHDIGRGVQYQTGEPHEQASAKIAPEILFKKRKFLKFCRQLSDTGIRKAQGILI